MAHLGRDEMQAGIHSSLIWCDVPPSATVTILARPSGSTGLGGEGLKSRRPSDGNPQLKHVRSCWLLLAGVQLTRELSWQHAEKDRGAAATELVANHERERIESSAVMQRGDVQAGRLVGGENQTRPVSGTTEPRLPRNRGQGI